MSEPLAPAIGRALADELNAAFGRIRHCLDQLSDEQLWHRPDAELNAIGNLILHLSGNLRQFIVSGIGGAADTRDRPAEFAARGPTPGRAGLLGGFEVTLADCRATLEKLSTDDWLRPRTIHGEMQTALHAAVKSVAHCRGHTQEIIHMTRALLGAKYRFAGQPSYKPADAK